MSCDPSALQQVGAIAAVLAAIGAFGAVYFASKSADAAMRSADSQTRPLLSDIPRVFLDQPEEIILPGGEISQTAITGDIRANHEKGWISLPIRNTGRGLAVIKRVQVEIPGLGGAREVTGGAPRAQIQPEEETRIIVGLTPVDQARERLVEAIAAMEPLIVGIEYTDFAGRQAQTSYFQLGALPKDLAWRVTDLWTNEGKISNG